MTIQEPNNLQVVIAGGGVAALETALALRELAPDRVETTLVAPTDEFVYRPMRVLEPFARRGANHYPLEDLTRDIGVQLTHDAFKWLDPEHRTLHTENGLAIPYDALVLAQGAFRRPAFEHVLTLDDSRLDEQLHGLIQDIEGGYVHKIAFVIPSRMPWPLPIYELALMAAERAYEMGIDADITIATPEDAPLAIFGQEVSTRLATLLTDANITTITSVHCEVVERGELSLHPGGRRLRFERIVSLPELYGPSTPGVPKDASNGFIAVDPHCRVKGLDRVWAAGDAIDFPVKHGGLAALQADAAAESIAALAGAPVEPKPFTPVIHAILLGGPKPLYLSAHLTGGHGSSSQVSEVPMWSPPVKVVAKYLAPFLAERERLATRPR